MIASGDDLAAARRSLGLSVRELADRLRLVGNGDVALREMESGKRAISGPLGVAVELLLRVRELERADPCPRACAGHGCPACDGSTDD